MKARTMRVVTAFHTTTDALATEARCRERGVPGRLIPLPSVISADCGLAWSAPAEAESAVRETLAAAGVKPAGIYQMLL